MGKPQKIRRMAGVQNDAEARDEQQAPSRQAMEGGPGTDIVSGESFNPLPPREAANYVHEMAIELKGLAESAKLSFLAYLLELVIEESAVQKRGRL